MGFVLIANSQDETFKEIKIQQCMDKSARALINIQICPIEVKGREN